MDFKKDCKELVDLIKIKLSVARKPSRNEDIATTLGYNRSYLSQLLSGRVKVTQDHIKNLKLHYKGLLGESGGDSEILAQVRVEDKLANYGALISVLVSEVAAISASISGEHPEVVTKRIYKAAADVRLLV